MKVVRFLNFGFKDFNERNLVEFEKCFISIIKKEMEQRKVNAIDLGGKLKKMGFPQPIIPILKGKRTQIPFEWYLCAMCILGYDIMLDRHNDEDLKTYIKTPIKNIER